VLAALCGPDKSAIAAPLDLLVRETSVPDLGPKPQIAEATSIRAMIVSTVVISTCEVQPIRRVAVLALTPLSSLACASEYCTKEQYERDHALIADAFSNGSLVKGPEGLRDSILVQEGEWYKMNYPQQIAFMQSFECSLGRGKKQFLYMDVRSLATGKLLATWP